MVNRLMLRLMVRELFRNWFQYLSMFVITALAAALFLGFISNTQTLRRRSEAYLEKSNLADLIVQTTAFEDADRERLTADASPEYRIYSDGEFASVGSPEGRIAKIFVSDGEINRPYITEGKAGFLIDKTVASLYHYRVGDRMKVTFTAFATVAERAAETFNEQLALYAPLFGSLIPELKDLEVTIPNEYEFEVTGLMHSVEGVNIYANSPVFLTKQTVIDAISEYVSAQLPLDNATFASFVTEEKVVERVAEVVNGLENQALFRFAAGTSASDVRDGIRSYFAGKEENNLLFVYDRDTMESVVILDNEAEQSESMLYVFPVIFFLVSVLVIMTSITRLILRERTNIGTFKALGMTSGRIVFHYAFMGVVVTFFGCLVGAAVGPPIVSTVMSIKYGLIFSMPLLVPIVYPLLWTAGFTAVVCALALLIGFWAARSVIRENPAECMRPKQISYTPHVKRGTGKSKESRHLLLSCRMAVRNIRINWGRSLMTVIGVAGCMALLVTSFGISDTMDNSVQNDYGVLCHYDVSTPYAEGRREEVTEGLDGLKARGLVLGYEAVRTYVATIHAEDAKDHSRYNKDISFYVIPENSSMSEVAKGGNTMSRITADVLHLKAGDTFSFTLGACNAEYTIDRIVETSTWNGFFTSENRFDEACFYQETFWVETAAHDVTLRGQVRDELNALNGTGTAKTMDDRIGEIESLIASTNAMKYTLMVFAILLSVVVLYNLSLLNVKERTRDMATLKVLGFTHFQVSFALIVEILLLTLIGMAIGSLFGYPLMYLVMKLNEMATMAFVYAITPVSYVLSVLLSLGTALVINLIFGLSISKISMTESLKSVE